MRYDETIKVPAHIRIEDLELAMEKVREVGYSDILHTPFRLTILIEEPEIVDNNPFDGWFIRDVLADLELELNALGFDWTPDRKFLVLP